MKGKLVIVFVDWVFYILELFDARPSPAILMLDIVLLIIMLS